MPKTYPWQRWPDKGKTKKNKKIRGTQTKESSWKKSSVEDLKKQAKKEKKEHPWASTKQALQIAKDHGKIKMQVSYKSRKQALTSLYSNYSQPENYQIRRSTPSDYGHRPDYPYIIEAKK